MTKNTVFLKNNLGNEFFLIAKLIEETLTVNVREYNSHKSNNK